MKKPNPSLQVLEAKDPLMPMTRGTDSGQWDASETGSAGISLTDLGGLKILVPSDRDEIRMEAGEGGAPVAVAGLRPKSGVSRPLPLHAAGEEMRNLTA